MVFSADQRDMGHDDTPMGNDMGPTASPSAWDPSAAAVFPAGSANISNLTITVDSTIPFAGLFNGLTNGLNNGAGVTEPDPYGNG